MSRPRRVRRRSQPRVEGGRVQVPSCVIVALQDRLDALAAKFGVSRSWVIAELLADALGVPFPDRYETRPPRSQNR